MASCVPTASMKLCAPSPSVSYLTLATPASPRSSTMSVAPNSRASVRAGEYLSGMFIFAGGNAPAYRGGFAQVITAGCWQRTLTPTRTLTLRQRDCLCRYPAAMSYCEPVRSA
jgi:hypothetical protein